MRNAALSMLLLIGCAMPTSQASYTYPGCEQDSYGPGCENDLTYECAIETIRRRHAACAADEDCVLVPVGSQPMRCYGTCHVAVSVAAQAAFATEIAFEEERYCATDAFCGTPGCAHRVARCIDERCEARSP